MKKFILQQLTCLALITPLFSAEFTITSYNCGGLSDHYDYLRAASIQKVMQERWNKEPDLLNLNDQIQKIALKILFSEDPLEKSLAQQEWNGKNYQEQLDNLLNPTSFSLWKEKMDEAITSYKIRSVCINDEDIQERIQQHIDQLAPPKEGNESFLDQVNKTRSIMAERIFKYYLKQDIICVQEADYIEPHHLPDHYNFASSGSLHSINGVIWNTHRFQCVEQIGDILGRAYLIKLKDLETDKVVLVASGHITGCHPYLVVGQDSQKGDQEIQTILELMDSQEDVDLKILAMDSNVASTHPRLKILKDASYQLDSTNYLDSTCSNPNLILNTKIDWILAKPETVDNFKITNISLAEIGLNSIETNISDHKPVAAKIMYAETK